MLPYSPSLTNPDRSQCIKGRIKDSESFFNRLWEEQRELAIEPDTKAGSSLPDLFLFRQKEAEAILELARTIRKEEVVPRMSRYVPLRPRVDGRQRQGRSKRKEGERPRQGIDRLRQDGEGSWKPPKEPNHVQQNRPRQEDDNRPSLSRETVRQPSHLTPDSSLLGQRASEVQGDDLQMVTSLDALALHGPVDNGSGALRRVVAFLEPERAFNVMTVQKASELSLLQSIEECTEEGAQTMIKTAEGRLVKPFAKAVVRWLWGPSPFVSFSLEFWVVPCHLER